MNKSSIDCINEDHNLKMSTNNQQLSVICKVRAQVMTRDEYTGGWLPLPIRGGSLCTVMLCKTANNSSNNSGTSTTEYFIIGKRIEDDKNVLNCCIKRDFIYNKVMPTFHHWKTNNSKFGLTFVTATEARLFDRAIREAFNNMFNNERENTFVYEQEYNEDEDIFMSLELPATSSSSSIVKMNPSLTTTASSHIHLTSISMPSSSPPSPASALTATTTITTTTTTNTTVNTIINHNSSPLSSKKSPLTLSYSPSFGHQIYPSVKNEYTHSTIAGDNFQKSSPQLKKKSAPLSLSAKNNNRNKPPLLLTVRKKSWKKKLSNGNENNEIGSNHGTEKNLRKRIQCKHCLQYYFPTSSSISSNKCDSNTNQDEEDKDNDFFLKCINSVTCIGCAQCVLYHCLDKTDKETDEPSLGHFCCSFSSSNSSTYSFSPSSSPTPPSSSNTCSSSYALTRGTNNTLSSINNNNNLNNSNYLTNSRKRHKKSHKKEPSQCLTKRSIILTILSFFIPCLLCYTPLKSCHKMSQKRKLCSFCCCREDSKVDKEICMARPQGDVTRNGVKTHHSRSTRFHEPM